MGRYVKSKYYQLQRWRKCSNDLVEKKLNSLLITSGWTGRSSTSYEILLLVFFFAITVQLESKELTYMYTLGSPTKLCLQN